MKPAVLHYIRPESVAEALHAIATHENAKFLAGGQSLVTLMNLRLSRPDVVIDIGHLRELERLFDDDGQMIIGALVRHRTLETDPLISARLPLLSEAARHIGHIGIRNRGTIGGSLAHADPAAELPLAVTVLDATVHVESAARGARTVPGAELFESFYTNSLEPDEMITWISMPTLGEGQNWGFVEYTRQHGDYALSGAGAVVTLDGDGRVACARVAVMNAGDKPRLFNGDDIVGAEPSDAMWWRCATDWAASLEPPADDPEYIRHLAAHAMAEALSAASDRTTKEEKDRRAR
ncbi:FAD binding domain-containing protein [Nocardia sp. KC 131]|uniref:FAD binding domain-containing protein n=1 Tax=Nocardia arseniciresistens TaxID=3392119 RepID=UPI00398E42DE